MFSKYLLKEWICLYENVTRKWHERISHAKFLKSIQLRRSSILILFMVPNQRWCAINFPLSTALCPLHKFWYLLLFSSKYFLVISLIISSLTYGLFIYLFGFLGLCLWHMEVPRLGVKSELQLPAYSMATATWDLSCVWELYNSSRQCQSLNSLKEARGGTCILMDTS